MDSLNLRCGRHSVLRIAIALVLLAFVTGLGIRTNEHTSNGVQTRSGADAENRRQATLVRQTEISAAEKAALNRLRQAESGLLATMSKVTQLRLENKSQEASAIVSNELRSLQDEWSAASDALLQMERIGSLAIAARVEQRDKQLYPGTRSAVDGAIAGMRSGSPRIGSRVE